MKTRIILVRHGETAWNRELVFRGRVDVPLNEHGRLQAEAVATAFKDQKLEAIYSSPLSRAVDTAKPLAELIHKEILIHDGLTDADFGDWQGVSVSEVEVRDPVRFWMWKERPWDIVFPNGESYRDIAERAYRALLEIAEKHAGTLAAIFTHRFVLKALICEAIGFHEGFWRVFVATGSISELWYEGGERFVLARLNDTNHLTSIAPAGQVDF